jgi:hypothetical protein
LLHRNGFIDSFGTLLLFCWTALEGYIANVNPDGFIYGRSPFSFFFFFCFHSVDFLPEPFLHANNINLPQQKRASQVAAYACASGLQWTGSIWQLSGGCFLPFFGSEEERNKTKTNFLASKTCYFPRHHTTITAPLAN